MVGFHISGTQHPSAEMSHFNTYVERLKAAGVDYSDYTLGMLLLNALPPKWDHVLAMYLHGKTDHTMINYTAVRNAIVAEYDRTSVSAGNSQHMHKISAVKRKGEHPSFKQQTGANQHKAEGSGWLNSEKKRRQERPRTKVRVMLMLLSTLPHQILSL